MKKRGNRAPRGKNEPPCRAHFKYSLMRKFFSKSSSWHARQNLGMFPYSSCIRADTCAIAPSLNDASSTNTAWQIRGRQNCILMRLMLPSCSVLSVRSSFVTLERFASRNGGSYLFSLISLSLLPRCQADTGHLRQADRLRDETGKCIFLHPFSYFHNARGGNYFYRSARSVSKYSFIRLTRSTRVSFKHVEGNRFHFGKYGNINTFSELEHGARYLQRVG